MLIKYIYNVYTDENLDNFNLPRFPFKHPNLVNVLDSRIKPRKPADDVPRTVPCPHKVGIAQFSTKKGTIWFYFPIFLKTM